MFVQSEMHFEKENNMRIYYFDIFSFYFSQFYQE